MAEQYLSIKEFAEMANVSQQSVYKRLKKPDDIIQSYIKIKDGKKVIAAAAIEKIYNSDSAAVYDEVEEAEEQPLRDDIIIILKGQVEQLQKELEIKNKQIEELTNRLKESSERETNFQTLLNQQQQLTATEKQRILQLESETMKKKRGIFGIFKKKEKEV